LSYYLKDRFSHIHKLVINQDNRPENHSRRTQFMNRMVAFAQQSQLNIELAYYPPYHSKYNAVERTFGWLEQHGNGSLLDSVETVLRWSRIFDLQRKKSSCQAH
jgi:transposase